MHPRIVEIERQIHSICDTRKELKFEHERMNTRIGSISSYFMMHIDQNLDTLTWSKDSVSNFSMLIDSVSYNIAKWLNDEWSRFSYAIRKISDCPWHIFDITSINHLYGDIISQLKEQGINFIANHTSEITELDCFKVVIRRFIADQINTFLYPFCEELNSLAKKYTKEADYYLNQKESELSACMYAIKNTFVSYLPEHIQPNTKNEKIRIDNPTDRASTNAIGAISNGIIGTLGRLLLNYSCASVSHESTNVTETFDEAEAAIYAPAEAMRGEDLLVQVFIYLPSEADLVSNLATQVDPDATRRNYVPLSQFLKHGDKIKFVLNSYGGEILDSPIYESTWCSRVLKHEFVLSIPKDYYKNSLLNSVIIFVNDVPVGEMKFKTRIVDSSPRTLWTEVQSQKFKKSFISYSHADIERIRFLAEGFRIQGVDYFFDEHSLRTGDNYPKEIDQYIADCDVFVLCWSKNAKKSKWVRRESDIALERYNKDNNSIRIYPISVIPTAELPPNMSEIFHFGKIE